ncbi:FK506-binding protein 5-like [Chenopodium quinoa]|uniref:FK506-binding protein 5-like n=1 Tax=Chenopodium quinoa TaxID=63459 RepID=UPI000B78231E|nr:FK506-binding protein 5-like [Chenopodium quinoa]
MESQGNNRGKGLAIKAGDQEDSEVDEEEVAMLVRRFKRMFNRNNKSRKFTKKPSTSKADSGCHKCESLEHFIRECPLWDTEKDIRKAMIAAWGDSESEDEEKKPEEETTHLCLMAKRDEKAYNDELAKEVFLDRNVLKTYSKDALIDLVFELEDDWTHTSIRLSESQRDLKVYKEHSAWIENQRNDVQSRFFELFDKNLLLKEMNEKLKFENIMVNVEQTQYKLANAEVSPSSSSESLPKFNENFEKLKYDLDELRIEKVLVRGNNTWYLDSGCSKHMTGDKSKFLSLEAYPGGTVTFGDNKKGEVIAKGKVGRCFVHNNGKRNIGKFDERSDEAVFLGYALNSKAYRVYNKNTLDREEDEETSKQTKEVREEPEQEHKENAEVPNQENPEEQDHGESSNKENGEETEEEVPQIGVPAREFQPKPFRYRGSHPTDLIISDNGRGTQTRSQLRNFCAF